MDRWMNHTRVPEERPWLRQVRSRVASGRLTLEWQFPFAIFLHLLDLVLDNDSLIDHPLEILIVCVEKLELDLIVESIQECILFLFISINFIQCIP
jgi:hypothetical protein